MKAVLASVLASVLAAIALVAPARADIITDWNSKALAVVGPERVGPVSTARTLAMMHIAMFDAANASEGKYLAYVAGLPEARGSSPVAAAHAAARRVLADLYPKQKAKIDADYEQALAQLPANAARAAGINAGEKAAAAILAARQSDGFFGAETYRPATAPGAYVTTALPVFSQLQLAKPFALRTVAHFRPGPPPALDSAQWARDYNETKELGGVNSAKRTPWQTETARFWVVPGVLAANEAVRALATSGPQPLVESARLFALANIAISDAYLAIFEAKYHYAFWRPLTAIRNGDRDGNDATERDPSWTPAIATPLHPEYPCAHCVVDGAAGAILKSVFGTGSLPQFTLSFAEMPDVTRSYTSIKQLEEEVFMARIWGGVHYRTSNEVGADIGHKVGQYVLENYLRPVR
jgi:hypothetical protein